METLPFVCNAIVVWLVYVQWWVNKSDTSMQIQIVRWSVHSGASSPNPDTSEFSGVGRRTTFPKPASASSTRLLPPYSSATLVVHSHGRTGQNIAKLAQPGVIGIRMAGLGFPRSRGSRMLPWCYVYVGERRYQGNTCYVQPHLADGRQQTTGRWQHGVQQSSALLYRNRAREAEFVAQKPKRLLSLLETIIEHMGRAGRRASPSRVLMT